MRRAVSTAPPYCPSLTFYSPPNTLDSRLEASLPSLTTQALLADVPVPEISVHTSVQNQTKHFIFQSLIPHRIQWLVQRSNKTHIAANSRQPFDCTDITEEIPEHAKMPPTWITGNGQTVYLVDCWYLVYENGNRQEPTERCDKCSKQGKLPTGTEIFIGGDEKGKWWVS